MYENFHITTIIPALNEENSVGSVVSELKQLQNNGLNLVDRIIVCDNGSTDNTTKIALDHGAEVVFEKTKGYGAACLSAISIIKQTDILLFINADQSEKISEVLPLIQTLIKNNADLVVGSRMLGTRERNALSLHQNFGTQIAAFLLSKIWGVAVTDLGPFRAIRFDSYQNLDMKDQNYGWTVEMQAKAISKGLKVIELPVSALIGASPSRVSGKFSGALFASLKILSFIVFHAFNHKILFR